MQVCVGMNRIAGSRLRRTEGEMSQTKLLAVQAETWSLGGDSGRLAQKKALGGR